MEGRAGPKGAIERAMLSAHTQTMLALLAEQAGRLVSVIRGPLTNYLQLAGCILHQFPLVDWATALLAMTSGTATVSTNTPSASAAISRRFMEFSL